MFMNVKPLAKYQRSKLILYTFVDKLCKNVSLQRSASVLRVLEQKASPRLRHT